MKFLCLLLLVSFAAVAQQNPDIIIRNGKIIDGSGKAGYYADVAIKNGKIEKISNTDNRKAVKEIDATGLIVSPGFIDVHTHIEGDEMENPLASNFIMDGVTSVVTGNCGNSRPDLKSYFTTLDSLKLSVNVASLIGHNTVRRAVIGSANRQPNAQELLQMQGIVEKAMKDGAIGLSTGLIYIPGTYSKTEEIIELAKIASLYNGLYASHMRDEGDSIVAAIEEAIRIGKEANLPVEISHFKVSGQQNWGRSNETIAMVSKARAAGLDVTIDQYPYTASSTSLSTLMPDWILADGNDSVKARLKRPEVRKSVNDHLIRQLKRRKLLHFSYPVVANHQADTTLNGKSIEEINQLKRKPLTTYHEAETIIEMMEKGGAAMVFHGMSEDDIKTIMRYPFNMFASDASIRIFNQGVPHPRGYGTNARVLSKYVREEKVITLDEAIRRMTSLPAQKFQLKNKGIIKEGFDADILVFSEDEVQDMSTFAQPHQYSKGFKYVLVNGKLTVENEKHTGVRGGKILLGSGASLN